MPKTRTLDPSPKPPIPAAIQTAAATTAKSLPSAGATQAFFMTDELAERWAISQRQVHRYLKSGALIATRFGRSVRVSAGEVARFEAERLGVG